MAYSKKLPKYKNISIFFLFILVFITNKTLSQGLYWSYPIPITDSVSDNRNPNFTNYFIFWEKSVDTLSTAIYMCDLYYFSNRRAVLSSPGINYKNPQFIEFYGYPMPDTLFYMIYETDENGNYDIYYKKYSSDGNFSEPIPLIKSLYNEINLSNDNGNLTWEENNNILYSRLTANKTFTDPIFIDQGNCHNPVIYENFIAYEKIKNDSSHIYYSKYNYGIGWSSPVLIFSSVSNSSLSFVSEGGIEILLWESFSNNIYKIYSYNFFDNTISNIGIQSNKKLNPKGIFIDYVINNENFENISYLTYNKEENNNMDIFVSYSLNSFQNISNNPANEIKPHFYIGNCNYSTCYLYNIWESFINDHWQLYESEAIIDIGGINENNSNKITAKINAYPNPFINDLNIDFKINHNSKVKLSVYDFNGKLIDVICDEYKNKGNYNYKWNLNNNKTSGVYYLILEVNDFKTIKKIININ